MRRRPSIGASVLVLAGFLALAGCTPSGTPDRAGIGGTPGATPSALTFTAEGDIGSSEHAAATLDQVRELDPAVHFALGDLSYGTTGEEGDWCAFVEEHVGPDIPVQLVAGNHESDGRNGAIEAFADCLPNRLPGLEGDYPRQYLVDLPAEAPLVRFVVISPGITFRGAEGAWSYAAGTERYDWTRAAIDGARDAGIPWVVVGMHKPCLSAGNYACDPGADLVDLLVSGGVDLVLTGHEHLYQRTDQLRFSGACESIAPDAITPACVADDGAALARGDGTVFVTVGTGGTTLRDVHPDDPDAAYFASWSGANADPSWGNLIVRVTPSALDVRFVAAVGRFEDRFRISADG
ncbi:metallophosphoesterase [Agromyces aurantiacus]|uniref:Metallophosphoesterase n=1 Tax=Agromyces aurantiacus TaxID=165814 RepID=A0ABV9R8V5_9MICO|nr:metallophosphoesterase [Agromyces aurantiacus]MBM7504938.1 3',5'-cyclic AMP phosphodiesterase CpdA [Agromyces aurantiacus]